ncbi:hypothetical protein RHGRI_026216 [Rhododendron griersonianum]|uniref:F-box domain-containing protein n=2 Tax=Rhododendron griersonianum TaxID=479676 RepID=A0AAV6IS44_9ERIC|nr:hypothetical protein RHGRI_026216 [Rhododendron griersonianum]KAG5531533.1 hypothetical protein RHGRI_026216 [Rhododendron griersonianum]
MVLEMNELDGIKIRRKKLKRIRSPMQDRISNLPWNTLDCILCHLPIRDAVRTSLLSKSWRYKWVTLSKLVFNYRSGNLEVDSLGEYELVNLVHRVLLAHCGQIDEFKLSTYNSISSSDVDHWISYLTKNDIRRLSLIFGFYPEMYELPPCIFSCQQITHLCINNCLLKPPLEFKGFDSPVSLNLESFSIDTIELERLIRSCPVLERLVLTNIISLPLFKVYGPNLKYLFLEGNFGDIHLENCSLLTDISFQMTSDGLESRQEFEEGSAYRLIQALGCLCGLRHLTFSCVFLKYLALSKGPEKLHVYKHLKALELSMNSYDLDEVVVAVLLLSGSSSLQELYISACNDVHVTHRPINFLDKLQANCYFNALRVVEIILHGYNSEQNSIPCWRLELEVIKFLLSRSPILEKMIIQMFGQGIQLHRLFMGELLEFERASPRVVITFFP